MAKVCIDLDDTLVSTQALYRESRLKFLTRMDELGYEGVTNIFDRIEAARIQTVGFTLDRWPGSMVECYAWFSVDDFDPEIAKEIAMIGYSAFLTYPPLMEGAVEMLQALKDDGHELYLHTMGDVETQVAKAEYQNIDSFFEYINVPEMKSPEAMRELIVIAQGEAKDMWMIGNSPHSDINPALKCGMKAILFDGETWMYDTDDVIEGRWWLAKTLAEVPDLIRENS